MKENKEVDWGASVKCPYCGANNVVYTKAMFDSLNGITTCQTCGKPLYDEPVQVKLPTFYKVLNLLPFLFIVLGVVLLFTPYTAAGISFIGFGIVLYVLMGIWNVLIHATAYLRKIAEHNIPRLMHTLGESNK